LAECKKANGVPKYQQFEEVTNEEEIDMKELEL
jgi:hypothetical protein